MPIFNSLKCLKAIFYMLEELVCHQGEGLVFFHTKTVPVSRRGGEGDETQRIGDGLDMETQRNAHTVFYHVGGVQNQVIGRGNLHPLVTVAEPTGQLVADALPPGQQQRYSQQVGG